VIPPPHDIVRAVRAELATPGRYHLHASAAPPHRAWFETALNWIGDQFTRLEQAIASRTHFGPEANAALGDIAILAALLVVGFIAARLLLLLQVERDGYAAMPLHGTRSAQALARAASDAAERGDYAHAIRLLFAAAVVLLDLRGVVADDESATVNELRRSLRSRNSEAERPFSALAGAYTAAAYAERGVDAAAWSSARDAYARLTEISS
jgi:hypothetical protein